MTPIPPRLFNLAALAVVVIGCVSAWLRRFILDDAFISFRYAANFVDGHGLVYNIGERVEGYTNFLWTLWLTVPHALGWDPVTFVYGTGLLSVAGTIALTLWVTRRLLGPGPALFAGLITALNPTFSSFATGGLETQWQALGVMACTAVAVALGKPVGKPAGVVTARRSASVLAIAWSLLAALTILTRMDSVVLLFGSFCLFALPASERSVRRVAQLLLPGGVLLVAWMLWRHGFYGEWLPNTFAAKSSIPGGWPVWLEHGVFYLVGWLLTYGWILTFAALVISGPTRWRSLGRTGGLAVLLPLVLWFAYVVRVGGDFMEFRMMVAVTPFVAILSAWIVARTQIAFVAGFGLLLLALGAFHTPILEGSPFTRRMESIPSLSRHLAADNSMNWIQLGKQLGAAFAGRSGADGLPVKLAVTAAGAIPYASGLPAVDMLGLTDSWIARHGRPYTDRAGHRIISPVHYLVEQRVHLLIGHPASGSAEARARGYRLRDIDPESYLYRDVESFPAGSSVVEMPVGNGETWAMIYLNPHDAIDELIASGAWTKTTLSVR